MGGAPSRESTTLYSYFRGTYEIGLIPLTKKFFGRPDSSSGSSSDDPTAAQRASTMELRRQFVHMRSDPAIVYANARQTVMASWPELMATTFTEDDLDRFLETVEAGLYGTDAEMLADRQRALVPVPCALCLACKEGQERSGCFMWNGRNIVVIGYFGCLQEEARSAFRVSKGVISPSAQIPPTTTTTTTTTGIAASSGSSSVDADTHSPKVDTESVKLFLSAAVLASAGDRTLERVLLLASVMLRNQYLDAVTRLRYQREGNPFGLNNTVEMSGAEATVSSASFSQPKVSLSDYTFCNSNPSALQARDEALEVLKNRLRHLIVYVEAAVDNYSSLKSLTENVAFLQCQTTVDPAMCVLELPEIVFDEAEPEVLDDMKFGSKSEEEEEQQQQHKETNVNIHAEGQKSNEDTSHISAQKEVVTGTAATTQEENVHDIKNEVAEKKEITPTLESGEETEKEKLKQVQGDENSGKLKKHTIDRNAPVELIRLHFGPSYAVSAFMWGAGLLTTPSYLNTGGWIQYKLKDESEELRQTLHSKDSIVAKWREECKDIASRYMGHNTDVLLRHVRRLQNEVEKARAVPLQDWPIDNLIQTREGRTCALHHTTIGTMLVGIRNRREGDSARKQERRKPSSREMNDRMGNTDGVLHCMGGSHDPRSRLCVAMPGQPNTPTHGKSVGTISSTSGTSHETGGPNMNAFAAFHGMGRMGPAPMYTQPPAGFPPQFPFIPQMQTSPGLAMGTNFIPAPMMVPCYPTQAGDHTSMERKTQQESSLSTFPTATVTGTTIAAAAGGSALPTSASLYQPQPQQQIPSGYVLDTSGDVMGRTFGAVAGGNINIARAAGDGTTFLSSQLPLPQQTNLQTPPYSYSFINPVAASSAGNFLTTAMPTAAPQQQLMMLQQGPGGMQVLVPIGSAPPTQHYSLPPQQQQQQQIQQIQQQQVQTPSFLPSYAFSQGAPGNTHIMMAPSQPVGAVPTWNAAQPNTGGAAVSGAGGISNVMYYLPTQ